MYGMSQSKKLIKNDQSFYLLANQVAAAIKRNKSKLDQGQQVERLMALEKKFKHSVLKYAQSREIYKRFLLMIVVENKNILSARPYFREKSVNFSKFITPAIKAADIEKLQTFDINFQMIKYIRDQWKGVFPKASESYYQKVAKAREVLIEDNMPLAINEAKKFYNKVPKNHVTLMDLITACADGLGSGIDKYCGPYTKVFRSVCIGRAKGNMIDIYSETTLHFYPVDRRILYKANAIRSRKRIEDLDELAAAVNESFAQDERDGKKGMKDKVTADQLRLLMTASSTVSADSKKGQEGHSVYSLTPSNLEDPETIVEKIDTMKHLIEAAQGLDLVSKKLLKLKGVSI
jgi:DNA-directed RNA polymerase specialized sigma subunit